MMKRRHAWPDGHWNWPIRVTHKHGVRCGEMVWVGGQVDLTPEGVVCNPGDLAAQTRNAMAHFARVLGELDCDLEDLVTLLCFYVNDGGVDESGFLAAVGECLPSGALPAVTAVPVPYLAYEGLRVEIEGYAMRRESGERTPRTFADANGASPLPAPFRQGVRSGRMIFVSAQSPVDAAGEVLHPGDIVAQTRQAMAQVGEVLASFGADYDDVVKLNRWYAGDVGIADFEPAALACAAQLLVQPALVAGVEGAGRRKRRPTPHPPQRRRAQRGDEQDRAAHPAEEPEVEALARQVGEHGVAEAVLEVEQDVVAAAARVELVADLGPHVLADRELAVVEADVDATRAHQLLLDLQRLCLGVLRTRLPRHVEDSRSPCNQHGGAERPDQQREGYSHGHALVVAPDGGAAGSATRSRAGCGANTTMPPRT